MRRFVTTAAIALVLATSAAAHDTWLLARARAVEPGAVVKLDLTSGMGFPALEYPIGPERVARAGFRLAGRERGIAGRRRGAGSLELRAKLPGPGVATFWVELKPKSLELEPDKVREYLDEIGAGEELRRQWEATKGTRPWREVYAKHAKTFVLVGRPEGDRSWAEPVGMRLEIVPDSDPTALRPGDTLAVRVLRDGKPFGGLALGAVRAGSPHAAMATTDADGRVTFTLDAPGLWMLRGTDLRRAAGGDWESDFTTLTVEVRAR